MQLLILLESTLFHFSPPEPHQDAYIFDLGGDMQQNLALIGTVPHGGIEQVRIHWLLDLITVIRYVTGICQTTKEINRLFF